MKNLMLQMLSEFILNNYDMLKKDYNSLTDKEKEGMPSSVFFIGVFDRILNQQNDSNHDQAKKIIESPKIITI